MHFVNRNNTRVLVPCTGLTVLQRLALRLALVKRVWFWGSLILCVSIVCVGLIMVYNGWLSGVGAASNVIVFALVMNFGLLVIYGFLSAWLYSVLEKMKRNPEFRFPSMQDETPSFMVLNAYRESIKPHVIGPRDGAVIQDWLAAQWQDDNEFVLGLLWRNSERQKVALLESIQARCDSFRQVDLHWPESFDRRCTELIQERRDAYATTLAEQLSYHQEMVDEYQKRLQGMEL